jgi:hypothetical protein
MAGESAFQIQMLDHEPRPRPAAAWIYFRRTTDMQTRRLIIAVLGILAGLGVLFAKSGGAQEDYTKWSQQETAKMFDDSPWAQMETYSFASVSGSMGENESKYQFAVRLFSAVPIRQAYVRMLQIMNHYDSLPTWVAWPRLARMTKWWWQLPIRPTTRMEAAI